MTTPNRLRWTVAACAALFATATSLPALAEDKSAEVIHLWVSAGERAAVKVIADRFTAAGGTWIDNAIAGAPAAKAASISRILAGDPPTASQFTATREYEDLVNKGYLADIDAVANAGGWRKLINPALLDIISYQGKIYLAPLDISAANFLFYNKSVFEKVGAPPPVAFDDAFFASLDKIKAAGIVPFAQGGSNNQYRWTFEAVMLSVGGPKHWMAVWKNRDQAAITGPEQRRAFETFARLRSYADDGVPGRLWNTATNMVITGKAGVQLMGDWAKGEYLAAGMTPGKEYGCTIVGSPSVMIMQNDVFGFPKQANTARAGAQQLLAQVMMDPVTQVQFNIKKGSIPARSDADTSQMDLCAQTEMRAAVGADTLVPNPRMMISPSVNGDYEDLIAEFWANPKMPIDEVMSRYARLLRDRS